MRGWRIGPQERGDHVVDVLVEIGTGHRAAGLQERLVLVQAQNCVGKERCRRRGIAGVLAFTGAVILA